MLPPQASAAPATGNKKWIGGIVPHAGWICSGAIAGQTIAAVAESFPQADVVVVFGAIHTPIAIDVAALDSHPLWQLPGETSELASEVQNTLIESSALFVTDARLHEHEHAIEVVLPLIQLSFKSARVLPIEVPANDNAIEIGRQTALQIQRSGCSAVFLASSDLTHYGPNYRFTPGGIGRGGLQWARDNDNRLLKLVSELAVERIVPEVRSRMNACGAGAIAAMLSAVRELGASETKLLRHASSFETLAEVAPQPPLNAVGYASVVVG